MQVVPVQIGVPLVLWVTMTLLTHGRLRHASWTQLERHIASLAKSMLRLSRHVSQPFLLLTVLVARYRTVLLKVPAAWLQVCGKPVASGERKALKPRGARRLVLALHGLDLPRPDKYGTVQLAAWLHQVVATGGFYDRTLDFVALEDVQIVGVIAPEGTPGRTPLTPRLASVVRVLALPPLAHRDARVIMARRAEHALAGWRASPADAARLCDALLVLVDEFAVAFPMSADAPQLAVSPADAIALVDTLARYHSSGDGGGGGAEVSLAEAACDATARALRGRLSTGEQRAHFDSLVQRVLLPALGARALPSGGVYSSLGASAQARLACREETTRLARWPDADFATLVRLWSTYTRGASRALLLSVTCKQTRSYFSLVAPQACGS
jgi:P-loop containing dynein motor region